MAEQLTGGPHPTPAPDSPEAVGSPAPSPSPAQALGSAAYEILRQRLQAEAELLRERLARLDARRREVFGSIEYTILKADRIVTAHNCIPRDMVQLGRGRFLFGFNVRFGLKHEMALEDVFAVYRREEAEGAFKESGLEVLQEKTFITDFKRLYNVYEKAAFSKFSLIDGNLYMVFTVGPGPTDLAVFKWVFNGGQLRYVDGRSEAEYRRIGFPPAHDFRWLTPDRESFRYGDHPHVSIEDRVFVECVGGDLTIKVEDNTATGEGIYAEPVVDRHQKVDDSEIAYTILDHLVLLRVRPYKEPAARCFIFNAKQQSVVRVDALGQSCARLPEGHGLVFPDGYYLATGEVKRFDARSDGLALERVVQAPGGEDVLYVFYDRTRGEYVLMPYRVIAQRVEERIVCHGFSLFADGHLLLFRADEEPQKHHQIQLRQTPFHQPGHEPPGQREAFLYRVGNKEVVRCLAEGHEVVTLARKESPYAELYVDLVKRCGSMLDAHPWLAGEDAFGVDAALRQVRDAADQAVDEFDKVHRLQREAVQQLTDIRRRCEERFRLLRRASFTRLEEFVENLSALRRLRGDLVSLKEVRYIDLPRIEESEQAVAAQADQLARGCVKFLLQPVALDPYRRQAEAQLAAVDQVARVAEGRKIEKAVADAGTGLELLIETVNSLRIEDATETTRIIDSITAVYSTLNQVKAALKKRLQSLAAAEGAAQFTAQLKLLGQSASSYLDLCDTPAKCDEYLNRLTVQLEELEGAFADFEEYTVQLAEKRTSLYEAFEQRKVALVEQRTRRAAALMTAAERILKVVQNRLAGFQKAEEINGYMATDPMVAKVQEIIGQLLALGDPVRADDLQGRLKSARQDALRLLKDRQELFVEGQAVIQLGRHRFNVNTQPIDLTVVLRDDVQHLHVTGTKYFEAIDDEEFLATRDAWDQQVVSENPRVYRAEYLAWRFFRSIESPDGCALEETRALPAETRLVRLQEFMATRPQEGYAKGIHDLDAERILGALLDTHLALQRASFPPSARAAAAVFWHRFCPAATRTLWSAKLGGFALRNRLFPGDPAQQDYIAALQGLIHGFAGETRLFPPALAPAAGEYLFHELVGGESFVVSQEAGRLTAAFHQHLVTRGNDDEFLRARQALAEHPVSELELVRDWIRGFLIGRPESAPYLDEVAALVFCGEAFPQAIVETGTTRVLEGMKGAHATLEGSRYRFDYLAFRDRLTAFERDVVPRFERFQQLKQELLERERGRLRLDDFKPRVLTSFVRNQLIDEVYLPLVGDNLAKQMGVAGDQKRTDLMGLLLLISPPGYGKTTLMEYIASRLGIVYVKINGPALGHEVTSLDPEAAPNAAAREEIQRLNLALEMGDNVMLCVDDIQHCHPEFLQKFISLCDAQRKIEGVWRGRPRTHDLRGRKVVVVMAGNPYTESGQKFKIPDMLANRADTYNLGDIIGGNAEWFKASYVENAVTSNPVLAPLANQSQKDVRAFVRIAATGERDVAGFEGSYSPAQVEEILSVMRRLVRVREVVLRVNQEYIHSASQADEFRTEPPFRLQGSYRNMNRLAEKVVAVMNDDELDALLLDHYRGEAQTLTTGAEANLLKFKELIGKLTAAEQARWDDIKQTFKRNQLMRGADASDPIGRVVAQLADFRGGLQSIGDTLEKQLSRPPAPVKLDLDLGLLSRSLEALRQVVEDRLTPPAAPSPAPPPSAAAEPPSSLQFTAALQDLREDLARALASLHTGSLADKVASLSHELEMIHSTLASLKDMAAQQRDHLRNAQDLLAARAKQGTVEIDLTQEMLTNERAFLEKFHQVLEEARQETTPPPRDPPSAPPPLPS